MPKLWATDRTACPLAISCKAWRLNRVVVLASWLAFHFRVHWIYCSKQHLCPSIRDHLNGGGQKMEQDIGSAGN